MNSHSKELAKIEADIDQAFATTPLLELSFSTATWTFLSFIEDLYLKIIVIDPVPEEHLQAHIDSILNRLSYPLRIINSTCEENTSPIGRRLNSEHYKFAWDWMEKTSDYFHFCTIFPLLHNSALDLKIEGDFLRPIGWDKTEFAYEYYDRMIDNRSFNPRVNPNPDEIADEILRFVTLTESGFKLAFNPKLVKTIFDHLAPMQKSRMSLPQDWEFCNFTIEEYGTVFTTIYAMVYGWFIARQFAAQNVEGLAYESAMWCPNGGELVKRVKRHTGLATDKVKTVVSYMTFGSQGIRNPDIAIQPIINLKNGHYALPTIVWLNTYWERNLCVLMNQIKDERKVYSKLVNHKEKYLRDQIKSELSSLEFEFIEGEVEGTDLDLGIVDHQSRSCLLIELKWLIEPAEVREVIQRSEDIAKGVDQVKVLMGLYEQRDRRLMDELLQIDSDYQVLGLVGSVNFVGNLSVQDEDVPVVKCWHLVKQLLKEKSVEKVVSWLKQRDYLPVENEDFEVIKQPIKVGDWKSEWYGLRPKYR